MFFWWLLCMLTFVALVAVIPYHVKKLFEWFWLNLEGAGRKMLVAIHAFKQEYGYQYPLPGSHYQRTQSGQGQRAGTWLPSPFLRPHGYTDPDRNELRVTINVSSKGAVEAAESSQTFKVVFRMAWSVAEWVRFYDHPGVPGDHGEIPENLIHKGSDIEAWFHTSQEKLTKRNEDFLPGSAVISFMNDYPGGEHFLRILESTTKYARQLFGLFKINELMNVSDTQPVTIDYRPPDIRGQPVDMTGIDPMPIACQNLEQFQRQVSQVLEVILRQELEVFGVYINELNIAELQFPQSLAERNRAQAARPDDAANIRQLTDALKGNVKELKKLGVDPDIAAAILAGTGAGGSSDTMSTLIMKALKRYSR